MIYKLILTYCLFISITACQRQVSFDSEKWKSSGGELILTDQRLQMTKDLLDRKLLINKEKIEIDSLLGQPTRTGLLNKNRSFYLVKEVYTIDIDPDEIIYIAVEFNDNGKSISAELIKE